MPMGAQVFASEAVTCPALLLSCLAGLQLPLACLLLIINSVLLYAGYSRVQRSNQNRSSRQGPTSTSACLLWWRWTLVVLINPALGGAAKQKHRQRQPQPQRAALTANSAASAAVQRSAAQHRRWGSTKCGTGQRRVRSAAPRRVCSHSHLQSAAIPSLIPAHAQPRAGALKTAPRPGVH